MTAFIVTTAAILFAVAAAIAITAWAEWGKAEVERHVQIALGEQAADHGEQTRAKVEADWHMPLSDADAEDYWDRYINPLGITSAEMRARFAADEVVDAHAMPLSQTPRAQRIRALIADGECRRFRDELDGWGDAS